MNNNQKSISKLPPYNLFALAILALSASSQAASFNCDKAMSPVEIHICRDIELSKLDEELNSIYKIALQNKEQKKSIRNRQKKWIKERDECSNVSCIKNTYLNQIALLKQFNSTHPQEGNCFAQIKNNLNQYDVHYQNGKTYVQPVTSGLYLTEKAVQVFDTDVDLVEARLCNGNRIVTWLPEPFRDFPRYLMAQIMDENFKPLSEEFRVSENNEHQNEQSVTALANGGFVVIWKSVTSRGIKISSVTINARLFDQFGKPLGKSFTVSSAQGTHFGISTYALPNGGFVVMWCTSNSGNYFKIYGPDGLKKTDAVLAVDTKGKFNLIPYGYVTKDGNINIFMESTSSTSYGKEAKTPFLFARTYDLNANALTEKLNSDSLQVLDGHQTVLEYVIRKHVLHGNYANIAGCSLGNGANVTEANRLKKFTTVNAVKEFLTKYCQAFQAKCKGKPALNHVIKYKKNDLEECSDVKVQTTTP